jgi:hypothetical protein
VAWSDTLTDAVPGQVAIAAWGDAVNANFAASGPHLIVRKPSDESSSSTTYQADNDLIAPVGANEVWLFQYVLKCTATSGADLKIQFTFPTGAVGANFKYIGRVPAGTLTDFENHTATSPLDIGGTGGAFFSHNVNSYGFLHGPLTLFYVNGSTAGNIGLEWAPDSAASITVKANSTLWGVKLA